MDLEPYLEAKGASEETRKKLEEYGVKDLTAIGTFSLAMPRQHRLQFTVEHVERIAWIDKNPH